jgi:hypothetical protein
MRKIGAEEEWESTDRDSGIFLPLVKKGRNPRLDGEQDKPLRYLKPREV